MNCSLAVEYVALPACPTAPTSASVHAVGINVTVNAIPLLATPDVTTTTLPVVAPLGTVTTMLVAPQLVAVATVPLNFTAPLPWAVPKFAPVSVTTSPTIPDVMDRLERLGAATTVKFDPLLFTPLANTTT